MKKESKLKKYRGVMIFYAIIVVATVALMADVHFDEMRAEEKYVMTTLSK